MKATLRPKGEQAAREGPLTPVHLSQLREFLCPVLARGVLHPPPWGDRLSKESSGSLQGPGSPLQRSDVPRLAGKGAVGSGDKTQQNVTPLRKPFRHEGRDPGSTMRAAFIPHLATEGKWKKTNETKRENRREGRVTEASAARRRRCDLVFTLKKNECVSAHVFH